MLLGVLVLGVRDGSTYSWDRGPVEFFDQHYYDTGPLRPLTRAAVLAGIGSASALAGPRSVLQLKPLQRRGCLRSYA